MKSQPKKEPYIMKKKLALTALMLISSLNPHRAQADPVFSVKNMCNLDKLSITCIAIAGALGTFTCKEPRIVGGLAGAFYAFITIGILKLFYTLAVGRNFEKELIQAIKKKNLAKVKDLCKEMLNMHSVDHYEVALWLEAARQEIGNVTDVSIKAKLFIIVDICDRQNLIIYNSARRI